MGLGGVRDGVRQTSLGALGVPGFRSSTESGAGFVRVWRGFGSDAAGQAHDEWDQA